MIGIYKLTSPSGKVYIGQSIDLKKRMNYYEINNCKNQKKLYNALKKYGFENFKVEYLYQTNIRFKFEKRMLDELEIFYIKYFDTYKNGYNMTFGGSSNCGRITSDDTKEKMRQSRLGKKLSDETKEKLSKSLYNSEKFKKRYKKILQYNDNGIFIKEWVSAIDIENKLGFNHTNIAKCCNNKINYSYNNFWTYKIDDNYILNLNKTVSFFKNELGKKMSSINKGRKHTVETKKKISVIKSKKIIE